MAAGGLLSIVGALPNPSLHAILVLARSAVLTSRGRVFMRAFADRSAKNHDTPPRSTVDSLVSLGFMPRATPHERLFALEPDDVHMERVL